MTVLRAAQNAAVFATPPYLTSGLQGSQSTAGPGFDSELTVATGKYLIQADQSSKVRVGVLSKPAAAYLGGRGAVAYLTLRRSQLLTVTSIKCLHSRPLFYEPRP